ncbi:hypothetical protein ABPG75_003627 [Micractinium tetrahymenae]
MVGATRLSARFQKRLDVARQVTAKYGLGNVVVTGHSLGGAQAVMINRKLGLECHAFNPGAGPVQLAWGIMDRMRATPRMLAKASTVYWCGFDLISFIAHFGPDCKVYVPRKPGIGAHSIDNFLP